MKAVYNDVVLENGKKGISFAVTTRKGSATGLFTDRIYVHLISGKECMKGLMDVLVKRFDCREITFTPLTNDNLKRVVKGGVVKVCKASDPENPYHEDFEYLECTWRDYTNSSFIGGL